MEEVLEDYRDQASSNPGASSVSQTTAQLVSSSGSFESQAKIACCSQNDVFRQTWLVKFVNCQVLLRGNESRGYLIVSASKAEARRRIHKPVWRHDESILSKSSWSGLV